MSTHPMRCSTCDRECVYDRCAPFGDQEAVYGVSWRCPEGHGLSVDVCPVGPLVPAPDLCLNCGGRYPSDPADAICGECGLSRQDCPASLGLADSAADHPLASAQADFAQGLFRRGLGTLNQALQEKPDLLEAWFLKSRFLHAVGFNRAAAGMLDGALPRFTGAVDRIALLEEQSFLWAECDNGEGALRSAEAAVALGSSSLRTHYLRGRGLALLGQLEQARDEMIQVLALDPNNADGRRALKMIEGAIGPRVTTSWWQFWKQ